MKKIGFGLAMLLAGCVSDPEVTEGGGLTPVSAMPTGTATYDGRISSFQAVNDFSVGDIRISNYEETLSADFALTADFDNRTTTGIATNARFENSFVGAKDGEIPIDINTTAAYSGIASGSGEIGTDDTGIYFYNYLSGTFTGTSATINGEPANVSDVVRYDRFSLDRMVSGYFTGSNASGIFGSETVDTEDTTPSYVRTRTNTVTGTRR